MPKTAVLGVAIWGWHWNWGNPHAFLCRNTQRNTIVGDLKKKKLTSIWWCFKWEMCWQMQLLSGAAIWRERDKWTQMQDSLADWGCGWYLLHRQDRQNIRWLRLNDWLTGLNWTAKHTEIRQSDDDDDRWVHTAH